MKKVMFITPCVLLIVVMVLYSRYFEYNLTTQDQVATMVFVVIPLALSVILVGIGYLIHLMQSINKH